MKDLQTGSSSTSATSPSLLARVRDQSPDAWAELVDLYSPLVANWCRHRRLGHADSADVMQEVFLTVARGLHGFRCGTRREGTFRAWLWAITRTRIMDWYRSRGELPAVGGSSNLRRCLEQSNDQQQRMESQSGMDESEPTSQLDLDHLLRRALKQIEAGVAHQTWQAFWRCIIDGQTTEAVAHELGLSCASVRQARSRVLRRLREQLGDC